MKTNEDLLACRTQIWGYFSPYLLLKYLENKGKPQRRENIRKRERQNGILVFYCAF
jgi:hypothetical protein